MGSQPVLANLRVEEAGNYARGPSKRTQDPLRLDSTGDSQLFSRVKNCPTLVVPDRDCDHGFERPTESGLLVAHIGNSTRLQAPTFTPKLDEAAPEETPRNHDWSIPDELQPGLERPCVRMSRFQEASGFWARGMSVGRPQLLCTLMPQQPTPQRSLQVTRAEVRVLKKARDQSRGKVRGRRALTKDDKDGDLVFKRKNESEKDYGRSKNKNKERKDKDKDKCKDKDKGKDVTKERAKTTLPRETDARKVRAVHKLLLEVVKLEQLESQTTALPVLDSALGIPLLPSQGGPTQ